MALILSHAIFLQVNLSDFAIPPIDLSNNSCSTTRSDIATVIQL
jgi:hypothetical protein